MCGWYGGAAAPSRSAVPGSGAAPDPQPAPHPLAVAGVGVEHTADLLEPGLLVGALRPVVRRLRREGDRGCPVVVLEAVTDERDDPRPHAASDQTGFADEQVDPERVLVGTDLERFGLPRPGEPSIELQVADRLAAE